NRMELLPPDSQADVVLTDVAAVSEEHRRWLWWLVAGSILLALAGGLACGWYAFRDRSAPTTQVREGGQLPKRDPLVDVQPLPPRLAIPVSKEELRLLDQVKKYDGKPDQMVQLLRSQVDLGVYYLKEGRLDDAEKVFKGLEEHPSKMKPSFT